MLNNSKKLDKFYTLQNVASACIEQLNIHDYDLVVEPSAGSGSFFNNIVHPNKVGMDVEPECDGIQQQDWFTYTINPNYSRVLVIGNPPFGKRNKLSVEFVKKATSTPNVQTVAFILPNVWNKHTLQKHIHRSFRIKSILELPNNSFTLDNILYNVPCSFFIMDRSTGLDLRFDPKKHVDTPDFIFGTKDDYTFFTMGSAPYNIKDVPSINNRGYYIKVKNGVDIDMVRARFKKADWTGYSSANGGVYWLTKPELVARYCFLYHGYSIGSPRNSLLNVSCDNLNMDSCEVLA